MDRALWVLGMLALAAALAIAMLAGDAIPDLVREHQARGRFVEVEVGTAPRRRVRVFVTDQGGSDARAVALLIHGMGGSSLLYRKVAPLLASAGLRVIALDLPGAGLSDKFTLEKWEREMSAVERLRATARVVASEIAEKGFLWRLEQLFESGDLPPGASAIAREQKVAEIVEWPVGGDAKETGDAIAQVIDALVPRHSDLHLVVHDSGTEAARALLSIISSSSRVGSVSLVDPSPASPALPGFLLGSPGVGSIVLRSSMLISWVIHSCCLRWPSAEVARAHGFLLRRGGGRAALLEMARMVDSSASLQSWGDCEARIQILWATGWSSEWKREGDRARAALPRAEFVAHSGSRWPQEDIPKEVVDAIANFIFVGNKTSIGR